MRKILGLVMDDWTWGVSSGEREISFSRNRESSNRLNN